MEELITVVIPVYNVEKYIRKCIDSVISQTYKKLEIILVDDGSTDNCGRICDMYAKKDDRIKVVHKENGGVSSARNRGIKEANGEWIVFVDSDDWIEKDFCETLLKITSKDVDCVMCGYNRIVDEQKIEIKGVNKKNQMKNSREYLICALSPQTSYGFCTMKLIRKKSMEGIQFNEKISVAEDALFNMQLAENINKILYINSKLYNYRLSFESVTKKYDRDYANKYLNSMKLCREYIFSKYKEDEEILQYYFNFVAFHVLLVAVNYCYNPQNSRKEGTLKQICKESVFYDGIAKSNYKNLSLTRKITLFTIKCRFYMVTGFFCKIRQFQNRRK